MKWTEEELVTVRQLFRDGVSDQSIAERLGRTVGAISNKRSRLKFTLGNRRPKRMFSPAEDAEILRRAEAGETSAEIASIYGVPRSTIQNKVNILRQEKAIAMPKKTRAITNRRCLGCSKQFGSPWPPAIERICPNCTRRGEAFW